jgi:hypothetical protein
VPGGFFSPQSRALGIDQGNYSPEVLKTIVYAGTQLTAFAQGSAALEALGRLNVATKQVERITKRIGQERVEQRDEAVQKFLTLPLMGRCKSAVANPPESNVASAVMDGGRVQILDRCKRDPGLAETADDDPPERNGHWREDKIGSRIDERYKTVHGRCSHDAQTTGLNDGRDKSACLAIRGNLGLGRVGARLRGQSAQGIRCRWCVGQQDNPEAMVQRLCRDPGFHPRVLVCVRVGNGGQQISHGLGCVYRLDSIGLEWLCRTGDRGASGSTIRTGGT